MTEFVAAGIGLFFLGMGVITYFRFKNGSFRFSEKADRKEKNRHHLVTTAMLIIFVTGGLAAYYFGGDPWWTVYCTSGIMTVIFLIRMVFTELGIRKKGY